MTHAHVGTVRHYCTISNNGGDARVHATNTLQGQIQKEGVEDIVVRAQAPSLGRSQGEKVALWTRMLHPGQIAFAKGS